MEFIFTLKYVLENNETTEAELMERLAVGGCEDALVGVGQKGRLALEFSRQAANAQEAMRSALKDVKKAAPFAKLVEATPDLVGLTDIADLVGVSRQNLRKLMLTHGAHFPSPVHDGTTSLWHLVDMLKWLETQLSYQLDPKLMQVAEATKQVNLIKQSQQIKASAKRKLLMLVTS